MLREPAICKTIIDVPIDVAATSEVQDLDSVESMEAAQDAFTGRLQSLVSAAFRETAVETAQEAAARVRADFLDLNLTELTAMVQKTTADTYAAALQEFETAGPERAEQLVLTASTVTEILQQSLDYSTNLSSTQEAVQEAVIEAVTAATANVTAAVQVVLDTQAEQARDLTTSLTDSLTGSLTSSLGISKEANDALRALEKLQEAETASLSESAGSARTLGRQVGGLAELVNSVITGKYGGLADSLEGALEGGLEGALEGEWRVAAHLGEPQEAALRPIAAQR